METNVCCLNVSTCHLRGKMDAIVDEDIKKTSA